MTKLSKEEKAKYQEAAKSRLFDYFKDMDILYTIHVRRMDSGRQLIIPLVHSDDRIWNIQGTIASAFDLKWSEKGPGGVWVYYTQDIAELLTKLLNKKINVHSL